MKNLIRLSAIFFTLPILAQESYPLAHMPYPAWKLSAVILNDWLYLYGGNKGGFRNLSSDDQLGDLWRVNLDGEGKWERVVQGIRRESLSMVTHEGAIYFIGGLTIWNKKGEAPDQHSTNQVWCFNPRDNGWKELTPLPEPRSAHGATIVEGKIYVFGGEHVNGNPRRGAIMNKNTYVGDLSTHPLKWSRIATPPFSLKNFATVHVGKKIYVIGGVAPGRQNSSAVHVYDTTNNIWSKGPDFPVNVERKGAGVAATVVGHAIYANGFGGGLYKLDTKTSVWTEANFDLQEARVYHQLQAYKNEKLFFIGGRARSGPLDLVEIANISDLQFEEEEKASVFNVQKYLQNFKETQPGSNAWPGYRGEGGNHSKARGLPLQWSENKGIAWRFKIPGYGQSTPVIWKDKVFVTSVEGAPKDTKRLITCINLKAGKECWTYSFEKPPMIDPNRTSMPAMLARAAPTPVVDEHGLYVFFTSGELAAFNHAGELLWERNLIDEFGMFQGDHGLGCSLAQNGDSLFLPVIHKGPSYLIKVDKKTGANQWKIDLNSAECYSTAAVSDPLSNSGEVLVSGGGTVKSFSVDTGEQLWYVEGIKENEVPSPTITQDLVIIAGGGRHDNLAIRRGGRGNVTKTHIAWHAESRPSGYGSPLVVDDEVYFSNRAGVAYCVSRKSGKLIWKSRMAAANWASPIAAGDRIYFFGNTGTTTVFKRGEKNPILMAENIVAIENTKLYGVAAVDRAFILRTGTDLFCVRKQ